METEHAVCPYCRNAFGSVKAAIEHGANEHPDDHLAYMFETLEASKMRYKQRTFKVLGRDVASKFDEVALDETTGKLIIPTSAPVDSPVRKLLKINTPSKSVHSQLFTEEESIRNYTDLQNDDSILHLEQLSEEFEAASITSDLNCDNQCSSHNETESHLDTTEESDQEEMAVTELQKLLPFVTSHLARNGRLEEWLTFFRLIESGEFNVKHISAQLFFDVLKFTHVDDVREMRYTPEVKRFWTVGKSLFKAKFLRYMGGFKAFLNDDEASEYRGRTMQKTDVTRLNFVVPNDDVIREERKLVAMDCKNPGIIQSNIDAVSCSSATNAFNLCIDGKKIASGFGKRLGDVNLFGHESEPTFRSRNERFEVEARAIDNAVQKLCGWFERDITELSEVSQDNKKTLHNDILDILSINTNRLKELKQLKVRRQLSLEKLMKLASEPWQKSKYGFAISSIKTHLHDINRCVQDILDLNTKLGLVAAACNEVESAFSLDNVVELQHQENYVCLNPANEVNATHINISSTVIKQRTGKWHSDRKTAKVTGSTIFQALGMGTLKKQQEHFDRVKNNSEDVSNMTSVTTDAMRLGIENEINAVGTLVGRILPILVPGAKFHEEGYYKSSHDSDHSFLIVSPDGSCRLDNGIYCGVEIKCPVPDKKFTTDVHYQIPKYYVTQILAEMFALECQQLLFVSWTPESTTVMKAAFDSELWDLIQDELHAIYGNVQSARPTKKRPAVGQLSSAIAKYIDEKVHLLLEIKSLRSVGCTHISETNPNVLTFSHDNKSTENSRLNQERAMKAIHLEVESIISVVKKEKNSLSEIYDILRLPAKEVLVAVLSDLDRKAGPNSVHGIPIAYGLAGYSLKVQCMRSLMEEIITECYKKGVNIRSLSTDGQFYRLCVRDKSDRPLTILQLAKDTWEKVKKMSKSDQVKQLLDLNVKPEEHEDTCSVLNSNLQTRTRAHETKPREPIIVYGWKNVSWPRLFNPRKLRELLNRRKQKQKQDVIDVELEVMPADAADSLLEIVIDEGTVGDDTHDNVNTNTMNENTDEAEIEVENPVEQIPMDTEDYVDEELSAAHIESTVDVNSLSMEFWADIISQIKAFDDGRKKGKWKNLNIDKLKNLLRADPSVLLRTFSKAELLACGRGFQNIVERVSKKPLSSLTKLELVNTFSAVFGSSKVLAAKWSPPKLKKILKDMLVKDFNKETLNAITATKMFIEQDLPLWRQESIFKDGINVGNDNSPFIWYSQPEYFDSVKEYIVYLLDCHHLFVNARSYVCQHDITGLNVKRDAWVKIAESNDAQETGLNKAMVVDLIDRQSNAIAQIVFGEKVEKKMIEKGWTSEANFCKCIREWYRAEDEAGLDTDTRYKYRMNIRNLLLNCVNLADFPPPGSHVAGIPIVMYEGILTNIDRRLQLHALVPGNAYNVRAPNTLAVENLFGGFQDLDPKSTGVLFPDDIPHAIETSSYIIKTRLDPERAFEMRTTRSSRVYPTNAIHVPTEASCESENMIQPICNLTRIPVRSHTFDNPKTEKRKPKRKMASIPDYRMPSRGTQPIRQFHKADTSKIFPHVRHGLNFE